MKKLLNILILLLLFTLSGCDGASAKHKPAVSACGSSSVLRSYPSEGCDIIQLNKTMPGEVPINATFDYTIKVTNVTDMTVANVVVTENIPGNLNVKNANPEKC
jgi:uncharacterized repeat protein (TIGR01451 family)